MMCEFQVIEAIKKIKISGISPMGWNKRTRTHFIMGSWARHKNNPNQRVQKCVGDMHSSGLVTTSCRGAFCKLKAVNAMLFRVRKEGSTLNRCSLRAQSFEDTGGTVLLEGRSSLC